LELKDRGYVYIDLSEDVTRYMLYGSKSIEFKSPSEYFKRLMHDLQSLDTDSFRKFVGENSKKLQEVFKISEDEVAATLVGQLQEELQRGAEASPELSEECKVLQNKVHDLAGKAFRQEMAHDFSQIVKKNGWRDGVVIAALRRGDSIIFDEFNKCQNWSLIYGLTTAKPGEKWYFADNDEYITIPDNWRMYFTANIGRKHGVFEMPEALASRAQGRIMEVGYPPPQEEMQVALAALANAEGDFLRLKEDLAKLYILVFELFPKIRDYIQDKSQIVPISYRTIRDLGEKLILYRDPETKKLVYSPTDKTFDEALYEVLVGSYSVYEDKTVPKEIIELATSIGLLLDDKVKDKVVGWIDKQTFEERQKTFQEHKEDFEEIVKKIRGMSDALADMFSRGILGMANDTSEMPLPKKKSFRK